MLDFSCVKVINLLRDHNTDLFVSFFVTECRHLVRNMLNVDQNERFSAEQVFRSAWCMKALKENPDLRYLDENLHLASFRKPSECVPQEKDEIGRYNFNKIGLLLRPLKAASRTVRSSPFSNGVEAQVRIRLLSPSFLGEGKYWLNKALRDERNVYEAAFNCFNNKPDLSFG